MPNRNTFLRSPLDRLVDEWGRDGGLPPLPEVTQPNASAQAQPNVRAQALPSLEELQQQLDSIAPGRFKVVTGEELSEAQKKTEAPKTEPAKPEAELRNYDPGITDHLVDAFRTLVGRGDDRPLIARIRSAASKVADALTPDALQRGLLGGKQAVALSLDMLGIGPKSVFGREADRVSAAAYLAQLDREIDRYAAPEDVQKAAARIAGAETVGDLMAALADDPLMSLRVIGDVALESLGLSAPTLGAVVAGSMAGPGGTAAGAGISSLATEYTQTILQKIRERGGNPYDVETWARALSDKEFMKEASESGLRRGIPIALFDAFTAGLAGRFLRKANMSSPRSVLAASGKEAGMQMAGGMAGETAAQLSDEGRVSSVGEVFLEGVAGLPSGVVEVGSNLASARARQREAAQDGAAQDSAVSSPLDQFEADLVGGAEVAVPADDTILQPGQPAVWRSNGQEIPLEVISVNERAPGDDRPHARVRMGENETLVPMEELAPAVEPAPSGPVGRAVQNAMRQAEAAVAEAEAPVEITGSQYATDGLPVRDVGLPGVEAVAPVGLADAGAVAATPGVDAVGRAVPAASGERSGIDLPSTDVAADSQPALSPELVLRTDGTPFKSEAAARQAMKNRRLQGYEPVEVDGGWALRPTEQPSDGGVPHFETYDDANDWIERRAKELGISRRAFSSTDEYKAIYPQIEALYQAQKAKTAEQRMAALRDAGLAVGDRVQTTVPGMFLDGTDYSGTIVLRGGEPWVKVDGKITVSKKGRLREASTVRWDSRWKKQTATAGAPAGAQQSMEAQDGLQEGRQEAQVSEPARGEPALVYRSDGSPFKTAQAARLAAKNRRLQGYEPVAVEGGFALAPVVAQEAQAAGSEAAPQPAEASDQQEIRRGEVGGKLSAGERVLTASGRVTTPFPKIDTSNNRKASNTLKRVDQWLMDNAIAEARSRGDEFNARQFEASRERPSQADKDSAEEYLFGEQPAVVRSPLKPMSKVPAAASPAAAPTGSVSEPAGQKATPSKRQTAKQKADAARQRTRDMLGAKEGDIVTPSADIGYSRAGESYRVISIGADGSVDVENVATGSRTQWSRSDLAAATRRGVEFARQEAATGAEAAPAAEQAGQKATPSKRQTDKQGAEPEQPKQEKAKPEVSKNRIFTDEAAEKARQVLRSKLGQLNIGIDPEIMQAGITLAGYHIEKGARTFAAYAKAMIEDMGEVVRPYLKSWYLGVRFDPRAAEFADDMDSAAAVESFDLDRLDEEPSTERRDPERRGDQAAARDQEREGAERSEPELTETVVTPSGRELEVRFKVVEADNLITSNDLTGRVNPDYPAELQPRDRSRATSQAQITEIAANINPRLLGSSPSATDGAPIVGPDNVVESGNGRTLALRLAYERGLESAEKYRRWLAEQGYNVEGMRAPVLVRERVTELTPEERQAFTVEANERTTLEMSATERAMADAQRVGEIIHLYRGGDVDAAANRDFVRAFADRVVSPSDRGRFIDRNGAVSVDGLRRMQAALVARAYGDEALVTALFESTDNDIRAIGGALLDVSGIWAQMRQEARDGLIAPGVDTTANLLEAVRIVRRARSEGRPIAELVGQNDMFAGAIDPTTLYFLGVLYRGENYTRARSRDKVAGALRYYTEQALLTQPTENMFGEPPVSGDEIARQTYERLQREDGQTDQQSDLFARPRADAADAGEAGGGRQRQGAGAASEADSPAAAEGDVDVPSTGESLERDRGQRGAGEPVVSETDADDSGAADAGAGVAGEGAGGARRAGQRDRGVSEAGAAARGERSNQPVYQPDGEFESARRAARDTERGGSRRDSDTGSAVEQERAADIARHAQTPRTGEFAERLAAQRAAKGVATDWGNPESIDAALPLLLPAQREDVLKAERRFAEHTGMLFTNGTGTGKTFTGLGIAKRFYNAGKRNILVVVPSDKVASDWVKSAGYLDLPLKQLASTADNGGSGPVVTTYANFGQNPTLVDREWDLVIADESHYLMSSEDAEVTHALAMLRALTGHPEGFYTWLTNKYRDLYQQYTAARDDLQNAGRNPDIPQEEYARREARANQLNAQWTELENRERSIWQQRWAEQRDLPRVTFLSATPFAYVKNVEYAEGYLFNYAPPAERFNMRSRGYNEGGPREQFFVQNFGYRMRNNRLTQPEAGVNVEFLERQFNERLKREGALSGRRLEVEHDYQRRFLLVEDAVGQKIDDGLKWLREHEGGRFRPLYDYVQEQFTYHQRMYLLEAIKAKRAIPHIKKHLALGRKVVVFHDFNKGGGFHPFQIPRRPGVKVSIYRDGKRQDVLWDDLVQAFENSRPDLVRLDMTDLHSPIVTMREAFPDALFFNGTISKGERRRNADLFNDDNSGRNIIVVQSDAGREGVSLHDTTGKHQRVMINLGMPTKPVAATQIEGRIYRTGQASDAIFDYITTGTAWEAHAFGTKIAERSSTAENLALGEEARGLKQAFIDAYQNAEFFEPSLEDGRGGKDYDRTMGVSAQVSAFDRAKTYYYAQQKNTKRRDQREGVDYFATPEPIGFKMVEWADVRENDNVLEPSAGHGAIARFVPDNARLTMVEPSYDLAQRAALARGDARIVNERFEDLHINNKYNAIVMNPPYGTGGKTAVEHLAKAAQHLRDGGRIVALLPRGGMADQRLNRFLASDEAKNLHTVAEILLPPSTFERAGTKVNSKILVLERQDNADTAAQLEQHHIDLSNAESVEELFDRIEHIDLPARLQSAEAEQAPQLEIVEHVTRTGKNIRGVIRTDLTRDQAEAIDPYTFRKRNADGETGFFIREKHLEELNKKHPPRFSVATSTAPRTSADLVAELRQSPLGGIIDQLLANNRVVLHDTVREIGPNVPAGVQGFTESDGSIHLVAEHLRPGTASSVLLHEAFHVGAQSLLDDAQWQRLNKRLGALYRQAQRSEGKLNEFWRQAYGRVEHAQRMGDRMSEAIAIEEFGAYAIENYERAPRTLKKWVDDLIGAIKAWLLRRFGVQLGDVTPAQLRALALAALRASAERPAVNIPRRPLGGVALNAGPLSVADIPETIEVDGVERPTTNSNGLPIAVTEEGIRNFWRWFGSSRVVDDQGRPLVVYHGTTGDIRAFDPEKLGQTTGADSAQAGFFFARDPVTASNYATAFEGRTVAELKRRMDAAEKKARRSGRQSDWAAYDALVQEYEAAALDESGVTDGANVIPAYLSLQNPLVYDFSGQQWEEGAFVKQIAIALTNGNDGVIFKNVADDPVDKARVGDVYVAFRPEQIKSATGNTGSFDPSTADIRYSVKPSEHFKDLTDEQKRFLDKIGPERLPQRLSDRWRQLTDNLGLRIRQAGVDRYAALLRNDQAIYGEDTLEGSIASSSWVLARMSHSAGGALTAMLNHGRIYLDPKEKVIDVREGTEGLRSVFQSLGTPQEIDRFMAWVAANRAKKLLGEGRENLFTPEEVDAGIKLSAGKLEDGRARPVVYQQAWEKFKQYRDDVLGIAEQAGIITPEQRQTWSEEFYVPFYRVLDDDTVGGPSPSSGLSRQQAYKRLKGGKQNLNDLLENTLLNFHHLIQASLKNQAAQQAVENAMELGIAEPTTESKRDKKLSTWVMVNGEKRWYNIHDPLTFKALSALAHPGYNHPLMKAGRAFKRLFTSLTTVTPQFVIANTLRDSLSAMATSPTSGVPFENALKGAAVYGNEYNRARMIASGGSFSFGHVYGQNPDDIKASLKGTLREGRLLSDPGLIPGALRNAWRKWQNVTDFAENVNRAGIWERNLEQGKLKAAFEARDLMDFSAHGDALIVRLLIDLVPFLNARIQGLDKLYRSGIKPGAKVLTGKGNKTDRKNFARFAAVTGALSLLSMLLYLRNWDDEEYRKLEDWQRDTYWFLRFGDNAFFIPKPFEVGAIATLAERGLEQFMDPTVAGKKFGERLWHMLTDTFAFDMPQIVKPVYELAANRDTFTGRPIEGIDMQRLSPSQRFRPDTSRLAEVISRGMEAVAGDAALSPVQIDHLIAGYLGQVGAGTVATADVLWRRAMGEQLPARRWSEYQPIRRFYRDLGVPAPYTRYSTDFYNALKETDRAYANVQHLLKYQEYERAAALEEKESDKLAMRKQLNKVARDLSKINAQMRQIQIDKTMDSEQKRYELDRLRELRNMITESVGKALEEERARKGAAERPSARP